MAGKLCGESFDKLRIKSGHRSFDKLKTSRILRQASCFAQKDEATKGKQYKSLGAVYTERSRMDSG
jgi:hypothetical protein